MSGAIRIIGIDPGLRHTGWGVIAVEGSRLGYLGSGTLRSKASDDLATRLCDLHEGLEAVIRELEPHEAAVENTFVNADPAATLKLGQARGIAMLAPARAGLAVAEYAPNAVKKAVIGAGHADKKQVQHMIRMLLPKSGFDSEHAADALAIAICHAHSRTPARVTERLAQRVSS